MASSFRNAQIAMADWLFAISAVICWMQRTKRLNFKRKFVKSNGFSALKSCISLPFWHCPVHLLWPPLKIQLMVRLWFVQRFKRQSLQLKVIFKSTVWILICAHISLWPSINCTSKVSKWIDPINLHLLWWFVIDLFIFWWCFILYD